MNHESKITTEHEEIRIWAEGRNGTPALVKAAEGKKGKGILRINFPGYSGEDSLQEVSWEEFFEIFEKENLAFLYQEQLSSGEESRFFKIVDRSKAEANK